MTGRSEEHTSELQSRGHLVCRLLLEKKKKTMGKKVLSKQRNSTIEKEPSDDQFEAYDTLLFYSKALTYFAPIAKDLYFYFFNDTATTEIYTLSLHDALPI